MTKKLKKLMALLLALSMTMSMVTVAALAEGGRSLTCDQEEHTHSEACCELTCGKKVGDGAVKGHTHTDDCYNMVEVPGELTCTEEHEHTEDCPRGKPTFERGELKCELEVAEAVPGHTHTDACKDLTCGKEEHPHTDECYVIDPEVHEGKDHGTSWRLENGVLTVSCSGEMYWGFSKDAPAQWHEYKEEITAVEIAEGVTNISRYAFYDCPNLENVTIASTVKSINSRSFENCPKLTSLDIPEGVTGIASYAFFETSLENVSLPATLQTIGGYSFMGSNLKEIEIPAGVTVQDCAFKNCVNLSKAVISEGVTTIGQAAFSGCSALREMEIPSTWTVIQPSTFYECTALERVELPDTLEVISRYAFYKCKSLKEVTIPGSVKELGHNVFRYCSALETLVVEDGLTAIPDYAFWNCDALTNVTLPETLTSLGGNALSECHGYDTVILPESLETLSGGAFWSSKGLKSIVIPKKVTELGKCLFQNCISLESLELHDGITAIRGSALRNCPLGVLEIPDSVTIIEERAFLDSTAKLVGTKKLLTVIGQENIAGASTIYLTDEPAEVEAIADCKVFFLNGGDVAEENGTVTITKAGATFAGWYEVPDFSGVKVEPEAGKVYYARWCTEHVWDAGVETTPATYDAEGVMTYTCDVCGIIRTEPIPVLVRPIPSTTYYTLTVNYVDAEGNEVAPAVTRRLEEGSRYTVESPAVEGMTPDQETVAGILNSRTRITVVYTAVEDVEGSEPPLVEAPEVIENPEPTESQPPETEEPDETEEPEELNENSTPLTETPDGTEELGENDIPLAEVPQTGDMLWLWVVLTVSSAAGLIWLSLEEKKGRRVA